MVAPILTTVSIKSDNSNQVLAGKTDNAILTFTADQPISIPIVTIDGIPADSIINTTGNTWRATKKLNISSTPGPIPFTIDFSNLIAEAGTQATTTTDGSIVTFDPLTVTIPKFADQARIYRDIGKLPDANLNRDNLVVRADEDSGSFLQAEFLNLVNFDEIGIDDQWFVDLATAIATAIFWMKSNATQEQKEAVTAKKTEATNIKIQRFHPQEYI